MTIQRCSRLVAAAALAAADIPVVVGIAAQSQKLLDFTKQYNMPRDHGFHTHRARYGGLDQLLAKTGGPKLPGSIHLETI